MPLILKTLWGRNWLFTVFVEVKQDLSDFYFDPIDMVIGYAHSGCGLSQSEFWHLQEQLRTSSTSGKKLNAVYSPNPQQRDEQVLKDSLHVYCGLLEHFPISLIYAYLW